ncbi:GNAT family N-acetyltransferase [Botryobacter ruber]|uniref:GNAT family N-acetyltransferase n=1 Tax=Botryobacter ruber TaxID=2171629 RepID=UPI000E0BC65C|nr:GNAT family N-acetyltransferase [Botryobacter ruber]
MEEVQVKHEEKYQQFTICCDGEDEAELAYALSEEGVINFTHTYVPESARGQGIAQKLLEEGFRFARENNYHIKATCPVAARFLERQDK